jgi:zinc finger HIT domain-containing protein 3
VTAIKPDHVLTLISCSVPCYKNHKGTYVVIHLYLVTYRLISDNTCGVTQLQASEEARHEPLGTPANGEEESLADPPTLRPLTSLKWPYVPDMPAYPDPLQRDDPKPLQTHQYEAIGMSLPSSMY